MTWALLADAIVVVHLAFVAFVVLGGLMVWRWPRLAWVHVPAAAWGALVEFRGWVCPLTPLEVSWRLRAGQEGYTGDFVEQYLLPILYPEGLTRGVQIALGVFVVVVNVGVYAALLLRARRRSAPEAAGR